MYIGLEKSQSCFVRQYWTKKKSARPEQHLDTNTIDDIDLLSDLMISI